jgi:hypothetical protein
MMSAAMQGVGILLGIPEWANGTELANAPRDIRQQTALVAFEVELGM